MKKTVILVLVIFLFGCNRIKTYDIKNIAGVKIISNSGEASNPDFTVKLNKLFSIQGFDEEKNPDTNSFYDIKEIRFDKFGNMFLSDKHSISIKKYSKDGQYLTSFVKKGNGPGELSEFISSFVVVADTVFVQGYGIIHKFSLDGKLLESGKFIENLFYTKFYHINDSLLYSSTTKIDKRGDDFPQDYFMHKEYLILHNSFRVKGLPVESYYVNFQQVLTNGTDDGFFSERACTVSSKNIYSTKRDKKNYSVNVFNINSEKIMVIEKAVSKIPYSEAENDFILNNLKDVTHGDIEKLKRIHDNKVQTVNLHYDKKSDYLWVERVMDLTSETITFDIFKDGIFINCFSFSVNEESFFPLRKDSYFTFNTGNLYYYNKAENKIDVYIIAYEREE